jgi:hypothetical protein
MASFVVVLNNGIDFSHLNYLPIKPDGWRRCLDSLRQCGSHGLATAKVSALGEQFFQTLQGVLRA